MTRSKTTATVGALMIVAVGLSAARLLSLPAKAAPAAAAKPSAAAAPPNDAPTAAATPASSATSTSGTAAGTTGRARIAELFAGKIYPMTLKTEDFDESYHMLKLFDVQGHFGKYVSRGDTLVFGGQTFIVAYDVPMTSGLASPPHPKPEATAQLILVNMNAVQAITEITPIPDADEPEPEKKVK
jgi:hypothetical protein